MGTCKQGRLAAWKGILKPDGDLAAEHVMHGPLVRITSLSICYPLFTLYSWFSLVCLSICPPHGFPDNYNNPPYITRCPDCACCREIPSYGWSEAHVEEEQE